MISQAKDGCMIFRAGLVGFWLAVFSLGMYLEWQGHSERRFADFSSIGAALERYHKDHGAFPLSNGSFSLKSDWIPGLVPDYLVAVPRDPRYLSNVQNKQYLYISNGVDYKLIAHAPEDFGFVSKAFPGRVDPRRPGYAYGVWTPGASAW